ncbi:hypothetical protein OG2516_00354 [Oceanicola granulosus HTCC2516]|uniref:DUF4174 domain-containing protein n=1 Tax=Oceanicola granulosus (strain ATCC BAA-861 / DSM 15982 / KCTC 12143 / HTCC2516) TaxID=314256 RepID=Q2CJG9_OCEGH|nr:DUF4174 domain-containing protein [Oceanicola granulosus]EAR52631.1 hypothetical protein OG2516_00354 [Oceanicola granulosus HTCC2516]
MRPSLPAILGLALLAAPVAAPLRAQQTASSDLQASDAVAEEMSPLDRWLAAPDTVFDAAEIDLDDFIWRARPIVVFADSPFDPSFQRQMELLADRPEDLVERDVLIVADTDPAAMSGVRQRLRPRGFMLALLGKDGEVDLRKPLPWDVREITRSIDKTPLRQQEVEERRRQGD